MTVPVMTDNKIKKSINGLSVDVEDYFHVSNFEHMVSFDQWEEFELRVEKNTLRVLELFAKHKATATFFILGWVAERLPDLVKEISKQGHEVASHGYRHRLVYNLTPDEFKSDLLKTNDILSGLTGKKVLGFRAPSYSITDKNLWALDVLKECGFLYDSSIFPIHHHRYGIPEFPRYKTEVALKDGSSITEFPISTLRLGSKNFPIGGGAYARLLPWWFLKFGYNRINKVEQKPFVFYFHPWEIDANQPRMECSAFTRLRHYGGLSRFASKLDKMLSAFQFTSIKNL